MKKLINIPKTNIVPLTKTINIAFRGYPIYLSWDDIYSKDLRNINIVSEYIIKMKESCDTDNNLEAKKKDANQNDFGSDLDNQRSELDEKREDKIIEDIEDKYDSLEFDTDFDENEEE